MMVGGQTWGAGGERYRLAVESLSLSILFYRCFLVVMYSLSISRLPLPIVFSPHLCTAAPPLPPFSPFSPHKPTGIMYEKKTAWAKYRAGSRVLHLTSIVRGCPGKDTDLWDGIAALKKKIEVPPVFSQSRRFGPLSRWHYSPRRSLSTSACACFGDPANVIVALI